MLSELLFLSFFFVYIILTGFTFLHYTHQKLFFPLAISIGFIVLLALLHLIAFPLMLLKASFSVLFCLYSGALLLLGVLSLIHFFRQHLYATIIHNFSFLIRECSKSPFLLVISLALITALVYTGVFCYHPSRDDGYYLARSMEVIANNSLSIHASISWFGKEIANYSDLTDASTLVFFVSFWSFLFHLSPTILCRRGLAILLIFLHLSAVTSTANSVFFRGSKQKTDKILFFLCFYIVFQLLGEKVCSAGNWLTNYIWQGKTMLMSLIFPLMIVVCADIIQKVDDSQPVKREWFAIAVLLTAGISASTVGLFLPAILFFTYGLSYIAFTGFHNFRKIILPAILSCLPVIVCALISYLNIATVNTRYFSIGRTEEWSWIGQFWRANDIFPFMLFIISVFYVIFMGNRPQRVFFAGAPVILLITFLNPLFSGFVSTYVTTAEVYWRLFWLLPIYLLPAFVLTELFDKLTESHLSKAMLCLLAGLTLIIGFKSETYYIIRPKTALILIEDALHLSYSRRENAYGISDVVYAFATSVQADWDGEDRPRFLTKYDDFLETRQYTERIVTYWAGQTETVQGMDLSQEDFISNYDNMEDAIAFQNIIESMGVNYFCLKNDSALFPVLPDKNVPLRTMNGITLFRVS